MIALSVMVVSTVLLVMVLVSLTRPGWSERKLYAWSLIVSAVLLFLNTMVRIVEDGSGWSQAHRLLAIVTAANLSASAGLLLGALYRSRGRSSLSQLGH